MSDSCPLCCPPQALDLPHRSWLTWLECLSSGSLFMPNPRQAEPRAGTGSPPRHGENRDVSNEPPPHLCFLSPPVTNSPWAPAGSCQPPWQETLVVPWRFMSIFPRFSFCFLIPSESTFVSIHSPNALPAPPKRAFPATKRPDSGTPSPVAPVSALMSAAPAAIQPLAEPLLGASTVGSRAWLLEAL